MKVLVISFRVVAKGFEEPGVETDEFDINIWDGEPEYSNSCLVLSSNDVLCVGNIAVHKK